MSKSFSPQKLLVTGCAGFVGSNFVDYWFKHHSFSRIVNLDLLTYSGSLKNLESLPLNVDYHFVHGDINDKELVKYLLRKYEIDTLVNFASESHVDNSIKDPEIFVKTNVLGTQALLESARAVWLKEKNWDAANCLYHQISTDEVYGDSGKLSCPFDEQSAYRPSSPYSASKAAADHFVQAYHRTYGLPISISHSSNNYGIHQHTEKLIPLVIKACLFGQKIPVYGDGKNKRDWISVQDHCAAIDLILHGNKVGQRYNVASGLEFENIEVVQKICKIFDRLKPRAQPYASLIEFVGDRPGHDWRYAISAEKIKKDLGWKCRHHFDDELLKLVQHHLEAYSAS